MGQPEKRRDWRRMRDRRSANEGARKATWTLGAVATALFIAAAVVQSQGAVAHHPSARATELTPEIVPAGRYQGTPRVQKAYVAAVCHDLANGSQC